jgi:hypothetical protein
MELKNAGIKLIEETIALDRNKLINHPIYSTLQNLSELRTFSEFHVFAVWDFMSLLKSLQINLTCTTLPWKPVGSANTRYLINEIVLGEESDVDEKGIRTSHFELYLKAMEEMGADTSTIKEFLVQLNSNNSLKEVISESNIHKAIKQFLAFTFDIVFNKAPHIQSSVFTFGREDLIPDMFVSMLNKLHSEYPEKVSTFKYYLERHIEVDGGHHKHLALQMVEELCGDNETYWKEAAHYAAESIKVRSNLWDAVLLSLSIQPKILLAETFN